MSITSIARTLLFTAVALSLGCFKPQTATDSSVEGSDEDGGGSGSGGSGGGAGGGSSATIYDIQMNTYSEGTIVTITDAVVTTQLTDGEYPAFFVQSAEGGAYNGIYIFKYDEVDYNPTIGDIVTITGEYTEFYGNSQLKVTEPGNIEVTGSGGTVVVTDVTEEPENWEAYESVVVRFTDMEISDASKLYDWGAVELAIGCWMDNDFTNYDAEDGASYASITGPMTYSFEKYAILPRSTEDLQGYNGTPGGGGGGSGDGETECDDGEDNDGDGYIDCDDWDCEDLEECGGSGGSGGSDPAGPGVDASIAEVQQGEVDEGERVTITGAIATSGLSTDGSGFFAQDVGGGSWSGIYVYVYDEVEAVLGELAAGDVVNFTGEIKEHYGLTEIKVTSPDDITLTGETADVSVDVMGDEPIDWETWEGCLITVESVTVTGDEDEYGGSPMDNGMYIGRDFMDVDAPDGTSFSSVTGPLTYDRDEYRILPRSTADIVE